MSLQEQFQMLVQKTTDFGIERRYINLNDLEGPQPPQWLMGQTLYEVYVRAFSPEGTFEGVTRRLDELQKAGIELLWFMPIYPIGKLNRKGRVGCPYAISDYFTVNEEYGSESDFKNLVEEAHKRGMKIILDMVANHVTPDYKYLQDHPEMIQRDETGEPLRQVKDWTDIADLDYSQPFTRKHMKEVITYWIEQFDIDGYRCDVAGMVPLDFWEDVVAEIRAIKPDFYMLAEWDSPLLHEHVFHSTYDWTLLSLMKQVHEQSEPAAVLKEWVDVKKQIYPGRSLFLRFLENHDKQRARKTFEGEALIAYLTFVFSIDGVPLIYNGQEIGAREYTSLFDRQPVDWQQSNQQLYRIYRTLIQLRRQYKALWSNQYYWYNDEDRERVLVFEKYADQPLLVAINFSNKAVELKSRALKTTLSDGKWLFNSYSNHETKGDINKLLPFQSVIVAVNNNAGA